VRHLEEVNDGIDAQCGDHGDDYAHVIPAQSDAGPGTVVDHVGFDASAGQVPKLTISFSETLFHLPHSEKKLRSTARLPIFVSEKDYYYYIGTA
jgi:hypothetical protein